MWTQVAAIALCRAVEEIAPNYGCHVALTGGTLYKDGERKDCDLVFYRIRQVEHIDVQQMMRALENIGLIPENDNGFCYKASYLGLPVDCLFPDRPLTTEQIERGYS